MAKSGSEQTYKISVNVLSVRQCMNQLFELDVPDEECKPRFNRVDHLKRKASIFDRFS